MFGLQVYESFGMNSNYKVACDFWDDNSGRLEQAQGVIWLDFMWKMDFIEENFSSTLQGSSSPSQNKIAKR